MTSSMRARWRRTTLAWGAVEIRALWGKTIHELDSGGVSSAQAILGQYNLRVTDIGSPLFKVDWPGAPLSKYIRLAKGDDSTILADFKKQEATSWPPVVAVAKAVQDPTRYAASISGGSRTRLRIARRSTTSCGLRRRRRAEARCRAGPRKRAASAILGDRSRSCECCWRR